MEWFIIIVMTSKFDMPGKNYIGMVYDCPFRKVRLAAVMMDVKKSDIFIKSPCVRYCL